jgi:hypothetical protein
MKVGKVGPGERPMLPAVRAGDELEWRSDAIPRHLPRSPSQEAAATARQRRNSHTHRPNQHMLLTGTREHFDAAPGRRKRSHDGPLERIDGIAIGLEKNRRVYGTSWRSRGEILVPEQFC